MLGGTWGSVVLKQEAELDPQGLAKTLRPQHDAGPASVWQMGLELKLRLGVALLQTVLE